MCAEFWNELNAVRLRCLGPLCSGDWNVIRSPEEKLGGGRLMADMKSFSDWINSNSLLDLRLNGASFTWPNNRGPPSMARLDRFLFSGEWVELYSYACQTGLPKPTSDPICLDSNNDRWGPSPFRFEMSWMQQEKFPALVSQWWKEFRVVGWAGFGLTMKLKTLKMKIKEWVRDHYGSVEAVESIILQEIQVLDRKEEAGFLNEDDRMCRQNRKSLLLRNSREEEVRWKQRSRSRWLQEGYKKAQFFHKMAFARNRFNRISVIIDGNQRLEKREDIIEHIHVFFF